MKWFLISAQGNVCRVPSGERRADLVRDLSGAMVGFFGNVCRVWLRPDRIEFQGFAALSQLIRETAAERNVLSWYRAGWNDEIMPSPSAAIERLIELMLEPQPNDRFHRRARPLDSLAATHRLSLLVDLWRANGTVDLRHEAEALANQTSGKYLVVYHDTDADEVKFAEFGKTKWAVYATTSWMKRCVGQRVENQPDYEYGCWTAAGYREAILNRVPTLSDMDTVVVDPTSGAEQRLRYYRLTLPVRGLDGKTCLLSTSCHDLSINLRPPVDHEAECIVDDVIRSLPR